MAETIKELGQVAFEAYKQVVNDRAYDGKPIPEWESLSSTVQAGWRAAAGTAATIQAERINGYFQEQDLPFDAPIEVLGKTYTRIEPSMFEWFVQGLLIVRKYVEETSIVAEHDQVWIAEGLRLSDDDETKMFSMGWLWDDSVGAWLYIT